MMAVVAIMAGLLPILWSSGTGDKKGGMMMVGDMHEDA